MLSAIPKSQKIFVMLGVMLAMLLSALDQTIVATAIPKMVHELNGLEHLSWVITSYLLASTIIVPIYGKLSDIYGRKPFILSAVVVFLVGSILSGISQTMFQLILFRGLQGLGGGAIMANAFATIGDLFPPAERGRWQGLFGGVFGLAAILGPALGGWLTDYASWRWTFYINLPIGIFALAVIWFLMPHIVPHVKSKSLDLLGSFLLTIGLIALLLGLVWGGNQYAWSSIQILGLFGISLTSFILFTRVEKKVSQPILPLSLFKNPIFKVSTAVIFLTAIGMFGAIIYIPLFVQLVLGATATSSGAILTPLMLGMVTASVTTGQLVARTGKYKHFAIFGLCLATVAMYFLSKMTVHTQQSELIIRIIAAGVGLGMTFPVFTLTVQNAFEHSKLGVVTSATQLARSIGGTVGTAILGSVLNNNLTNKLGAGVDINKLQGLTLVTGQEEMMAVKLFLLKAKGTFASSITEVFLISSFCIGLAALVAFFLKEIPLRKSHIEPLEEAGKELAMEEGVFPPKDEVKI